MINENDNIRTNSIEAWLLAARPKTLAGAAVPVMIAVALALKTTGWSHFRLIPAVLCFLFAFLMQIDSNFINDYFDFIKGTDDTEKRLGPRRACAQGWVKPQSMRYAIALTTIAACVAGLPLIFYGGVEMILVGAVCVVFCFLYTTYLSYVGLGDVLVLVFFGLVPVCITYPTREELAALTYRSKKEIEGQVRIVSIPGADVCACCGTHTAATGQVGQIKILTSENYKGGVRLSVVCGGRALREAQAMRSRQADIGALLSAKADQTAVAVHRVYDEYTALKFAHFGLCSQLFDALAAQLGPDETAIRTVPGLDPDGLHRLAARLSEATTGLCAALTPSEKGTGYCIAQAGGDVRALTKALNAALNGRGGGKPGICQGSCAATPEQVEEFLKKDL